MWARKDTKQVSMLNALIAAREQVSMQAREHASSQATQIRDSADPNENIIYKQPAILL